MMGVFALLPFKKRAERSFPGREKRNEGSDRESKKG